jgi:hypothetical protein
MRGIEVLWLEILWGTRRLQCEKYTPRGKHRTEVTEGDWVLFSFSPTRPHADTCSQIGHRGGLGFCFRRHAPPPTGRHVLPIAYTCSQRPNFKALTW